MFPFVHRYIFHVPLDVPVCRCFRDSSLGLLKSGLVAAKPVLARVQAHRRGGGGAPGGRMIYISLSREFFIFFYFGFPF